MEYVNINIIFIHIRHFKGIVTVQVAFSGNYNCYCVAHATWHTLILTFYILNLH